MAAPVLDRFVEAVLSHRAEPPMVGPVVLPDEDAAPETNHPNGIVYGAAEGQYFIIDYIDSRGQQSRRRITVYSVVAGAGGIPCLFGRCHERKADRQFRMDRIQCVIDRYGEIHEDVLSFLCEGLGLDNGAVSSAIEKALIDKPPQVVSVVRDFALALVAVAACDGHRHKQEMDSILVACVHRCDRLRIDVNDTEIEKIRRYLSRLMPTDEMFRKALDRIIGMPPREIVAFLRACRDVAEADAKLHSEELLLLDELSLELTGVRSLG